MKKKQVRLRNRIVIDVQGGNIQGVWAADPDDVQIVLIDWDNIKESGGEGGTVELDVEPLAGLPLDDQEQIEKTAIEEA